MIMFATKTNQPKRVIVTGANGFLGAALVKKLFLQGYQVDAIVRSEDSNIAAIRSYARVIPCPLCDIHLLALSQSSDHGSPAHACAQDGYAAFVHLAWEGSSGALRSDEQTQLANVNGVCNAIRIAKQLGCEKFIFAGSIMQYEAEAARHAGIKPPLSSFYSYAKTAACALGEALAWNLDIPFITAVISHIYGPGEISSRFISFVLQSIARGQRVPLTSGTQEYDFIYIEDAATAFYSLIDSPLSAAKYYIGSQQPKPLRIFMEELGIALHASDLLSFGEVPFNGVSLSYRELFDIEALARETGFTPGTTFTQGLQSTMQWLKSNDRNGDL